MKKLLFILLAVVLLTSCEDTIPIKQIENPKEVTTLEILEKANSDTLCYKVAIIDNTIYVLHNNLVQTKVVNKDTDPGFFIFIGVLITTLLFLFTAVIVNS